jgi:hypothetical protein
VLSELDDVAEQDRDEGRRDGAPTMPRAGCLHVASRATARHSSTTPDATTTTFSSIGSQDGTCAEKSAGEGQVSGAGEQQQRTPDDLAGRADRASHGRLLFSAWAA